MINVHDVDWTFSRIADRWETKTKHIKTLHGNDNLMPRLVAKAIELQGARAIIDVGCGTAKLLHEIDSSYTGLHLTAVDVSNRMLATAKARDWRNEITFIQADATTYESPVPADLVILKQVLHHVSDQAAFLKAVSNSLKESGLLAVMLPNPHHGHEAAPFQRGADPLGRMDLDDVVVLLQSCGFVVEEHHETLATASFSSLYHYFMHLWSIGSIQKLADYNGASEAFLSVVERLDLLLSRTPAPDITFGYSYFTARKRG